MKHPFLKALTAPDQQDDLKVQKSSADNELYRWVWLSESSVKSKLICQKFLRLINFAAVHFAAVWNSKTIARSVLWDLVVVSRMTVKFIFVLRGR